MHAISWRINPDTSSGWIKSWKFNFFSQSGNLLTPGSFPGAGSINPRFEGNSIIAIFAIREHLLKRDGFHNCFSKVKIGIEIFKNEMVHIQICI
jgi:hypothetical protein